MTLNELNKYFNSFLKTENFPNDISLNGIQIQNREPNKKQIKKVAFAVDACLETAKQAKKNWSRCTFCSPWNILGTMSNSNRIILQHNSRIYK